MVGPTVSEEVAGAYWQQCAKIDGCQDRTRLTDPIANPGRKPGGIIDTPFRIAVKSINLPLNQNSHEAQIMKNRLRLVALLLSVLLVFSGCSSLVSLNNASHILSKESSIEELHSPESSSSAINEPTQTTSETLTDKTTEAQTENPSETQAETPDRISNRNSVLESVEPATEITEAPTEKENTEEPAETETEKSTEESEESQTEEPTEEPTEESEKAETEESAEDPSESEEPETEESTEEVPENEENKRTYILNTNTKKFHYPWCDSVNRMKDKNKQEYTGTREEIINMGYDPCKNCNP